MELVNITGSDDSTVPHLYIHILDYYETLTVTNCNYDYVVLLNPIIQLCSDFPVPVVFTN